MNTQQASPHGVQPPLGRVPCLVPLCPLPQVHVTLLQHKLHLHVGRREREVEWVAGSAASTCFGVPDILGTNLRHHELNVLGIFPSLSPAHQQAHVTSRHSSKHTPPARTWLSSVRPHASICTQPGHPRRLSRMLASAKALAIRSSSPTSSTCTCVCVCVLSGCAGIRVQPIRVWRHPPRPPP